MNPQVLIEEEVLMSAQIKKDIKVCAVQLNLKNCINQDQFLKYIESEVFLKNTNADLFVFPENINFSLLFAKYNIFRSKSFRSFYENLINKFLSILDLSFVFNYQKLDDQKNIILETFVHLAKKYNCNITTGSFYEKKKDGIYNSIYAIDRSGNIIGSSSKKDLVGLEKAFRIKSSNQNTVIEFDCVKVGLSICFDINDKEFCSKFDCDILVAPSNGWRPFPGYPFDSKKETPQIQRAKENNYVVMRPYCAGWLGPLYFSGRTMIVDKDGDILSQSVTRNKTELVFATIVV
jgi:predicted amidohydrolase